MHGFLVLDWGPLFASLPAFRGSCLWNPLVCVAPSSGSTIKTIPCRCAGLGHCPLTPSLHAKEPGALALTVAGWLRPTQRASQSPAADPAVGLWAVSAFSNLSALPKVSNACSGGGLKLRLQSLTRGRSPSSSKLLVF